MIQRDKNFRIKEVIPRRKENRKKLRRDDNRPFRPDKNRSSKLVLSKGSFTRPSPIYLSQKR